MQTAFALGDRNSLKRAPPGLVVPRPNAILKDRYDQALPAPDQVPASF